MLFFLRWFTCHLQLLAVALLAFFLDCDLTLVAPRVGSPGRVQFKRHLIFSGGDAVDENLVTPELEGVAQVCSVVVTDGDLALQGD